MASIVQSSASDIGDDEYTLESVSTLVGGVTELISQLDKKVEILIRGQAEISDRLNALAVKSAVDSVAPIGQGMAGVGGLNVQPVSTSHSSAGNKLTKRDHMNSPVTFNIPMSRGVYRTNPHGQDVVDSRKIALCFTPIAKFDKDCEGSIDAGVLIYRDAYIGFVNGVAPNDSGWGAIEQAMRQPIENQMARLKSIMLRIRDLPCSASYFAMTAQTIPPAYQQAIRDLLNELNEVFKRSVSQARFPFVLESLASLFQIYSRAARIPYTRTKEKGASLTTSFTNSGIGIAWYLRLPAQSKQLLSIPLASYNEGFDFIVPVITAPLPPSVPPPQMPQQPLPSIPQSTPR